MPILRIDLDELSDPTPILAVAGNRVWVEAVRNDQVVGLLEAQVLENGQLPTSVFEVFARNPPSAPAIESIADEKLPFASVVVPSIVRDVPQLSRTVSSLLDLKYPNYEVIVVDNRSGGERLSLSEFDGNERLRIVVEPFPGASAARNKGIGVAIGEFIAFTDDDAIADKNWLRVLGSRFAQSSEVEGIGGLVLPLEFQTEAQLWFEEFYGGFTKAFSPQLLSVRDSKRPDALFPYGPGLFGAGCNMAFRRSTLVRMGGFNVSLGPGTPSKGGEDPAVFIELATSGGVVALEPGAVVRHSHRKTHKEFMSQVFGYGTGLTAMYTSLIVRDPRHLLALLRRVPAGWKLMTRPRHDRSPSTAPSYPLRTYGFQILGMAYGPVAYARSALKTRHRSDN
jgi:hypothetical protein